MNLLERPRGLCQVPNTDVSISTHIRPHFDLPSPVVNDNGRCRSQRNQKMRKCEDHVDIQHGQEFRLTCGKPLVTGVGLTLRTVTIADELYEMA